MGMQNEDEILKEMIKIGVWSEAEQKELDKLPKDIEGLKVDLYNAFFQFKRRDNIRKALSNLKFKESELIQKREKLRYTTCEGYALSCKNKYLICVCAKRIDNSSFFLDYDQVSSSELDLLVQQFYEQRIDDDTIRELSKGEPWKSMWAAGKHEGSIFGQPSSLLTQEQKMIVIWSRIYDSVYENSDCPPEEVVDDNDCLDGWMIFQAKKRENDRKSEHGYKPGDKFNKADEVFIMVENEDDISRVESMNSPTAIFRKQQRKAALVAAGGKIAEEFMPDSQQTMRQQLMQMQRERNK
jgi:hypothetical protein